MTHLDDRRRTPVLDDAATPQAGEETTKAPDHPPRSSARALLKHAGTWVGDDAEQCLREVYAARGEAIF